MDQRVTSRSDDTGLTPDEVRAAVRAFFADKPGTVEVRAHLEVPGSFGFDQNTWTSLADGVGLVALCAPSAWSGMGLGIRAAVAAIEECGATLYPGPARSAVALALMLGDVVPHQLSVNGRDVISGVLVGSEVVGEALPGSSDVAVRAGLAKGGIRAAGHGMSASAVIVETRTPDGVAVALIDVRSSGRTPVASTDLAGALGSIEVDGVEAHLLTVPGDDAALCRYRQLARILLAAEQVGGAQACLNQMVAHAGIREQFGSVIGTYQAVAHHCSRTAVDVAAARGLVDAAARAWESGSGSAAEQLSLLARAEATEVFCEASTTLIQVCGGIGFTWEHEAHLYFRRARASASVGGSPQQLRDRAADVGCIELLTAG